MSDERNITSRPSSLQVPEFESTIPPHLLGNLNPQERWLVETFSKTAQKQEWIANRVIEIYTDQQDHKSRLDKIENWKSIFSGKMAVVTSVGLILTSAFVGALFKLMIEKIFGK
jgi:hypothetical protein